MQWLQHSGQRCCTELLTLAYSIMATQLVLAGKCVVPSPQRPHHAFRGILKAAAQTPGRLLQKNVRQPKH